MSDYSAEIFYGIVAPAKTPVDTLKSADWFADALKSPDMKPKLAKQGLLPIGTCDGDFGAYMRHQIEEYSRVIREANITLK